MADEQDYKKLYEQEQKKVNVLQNRLKLYEDDATYRGYYILNKVVNEQIDILAVLKLSEEIGSNPKEDKKYDRVKSLWEGMKGMITDLNALKIELKITGKQEEDNKRVPLIERFAETRK